MSQWSRQPKEPIRWFTRFEIFRLMGPDRSILGAYREYLARKGDERHLRSRLSRPTSWTKNSIKWHWQERAEVWDMEEHQKLLVLVAKDNADMLERHRQWGKLLQGVGGARLALIKRVEGKDGKTKLVPSKMRYSEARKFIKAGTDLERTASGFPTDILEVRALSDDQLLARYRGTQTVLRPAGDGDAEAGADDPDDGDESVREIPGEVLE